MNILILGRGNYSLLNRRIDSLREKGQKVFFISLQPHAKLHDDNFYIKPVAKGLLGYLLAMPKVFSLLKSLNYDAIDFHGASSYALFSLLIRRKYMISIYGPDVYDFALRNVIAKYVVNFILFRAHTLSCSVGTVHDYLKPFKGLLDKRYAIVPYGVNPIVDYTEKRKQFRKLFNINDSDNVFIHCRRFMQFWKVDIIAKAFINLHSNNSIFLFVYPQPTNEERILVEKVKHELEMAGMLDRVIFIDGLDYAEYLSAQCASDVFICIGENDLLANSVIEGMLCQNVMILNKLKSYEISLLKNEIIWLDANNIDDKLLSSAMHTACNIVPSRKKEIIQRNSEYIEANFIEAKCTDLLVEEYKML